MYETKKATAVFLLVNAQGEWFVERRFEDEDEVIGFIAERCRREPSDGTIVSDLLDSINATGNDVERFHYDAERGEAVYERLRPYRFVDADGRVTDPRIFEDEIMNRFVASEGMRKRKRRRSAEHGFRKDPIPYTGKGKKMKRRRYRTWFRNRRLDLIPEYGGYVRKKAVVKDGWDDWDGVPFRRVSKSWKDNSKRRRQWKDAG